MLFSFCLSRIKARANPPPKKMELCDDVWGVVFKNADIITLKTCLLVDKNFHSLVYPILERRCKKIVPKFPKKCNCKIDSYLAQQIPKKSDSETDLHLIVVPPPDCRMFVDLNEDVSTIMFQTHERDYDNMPCIIDEQIKFCEHCNGICLDTKTASWAYCEWMYKNIETYIPRTAKHLLDHEVTLTEDVVTTFFKGILPKMIELCKDAEQCDVKKWLNKLNVCDDVLK